MIERRIESFLSPPLSLSLFTQDFFEVRKDFWICHTQKQSDGDDPSMGFRWRFGIDAMIFQKKYFDYVVVRKFMYVLEENSQWKATHTRDLYHEFMK